MKPERWKQVDDLLEAALECPAAERASFLDRACAGDEELRQELDSLVIPERQAVAFLESPPSRVAADLFTDKQPNPGKVARIAHYEIIEMIGSGGMGEVYLAQDTKLGRRVALKLLPASLTSDPQVRARFFREAQLASALDHPNVCTIQRLGSLQATCLLPCNTSRGSTSRSSSDLAQ